MKEKIIKEIADYEKMIQDCYKYLGAHLKKDLPVYKKLNRIDYYRDLICSYNSILGELYHLLSYCKEGDK